MRSRRVLTTTLLVPLVLGGAACGDDEPSDAAASTSRPPAAAGPLQVSLTGGPDWLVADDDAVYVHRDDASVVRLDPETLEVEGTYDLGGGLCQGTGAGFGSIWTCRDTDVVRLDGATGEVEATFEVGKAHDQGNLATAFDRVWVLAGDGSDLVAIDPATDTAGAPVALGVRGTDLVADERAVWVVSRPDRALVRFDPATATAGPPIALPGEAQSVAAAEGAVWVGVGTMTVRVDPETMSLVAEGPVGPGRTGSLAVEGGVVHVRSSDGLARLDATTLEVLEEVPLDGVTSGGDSLLAFGALYTAAFDDGLVLRIPLP